MKNFSVCCYHLIITDFLNVINTQAKQQKLENKEDKSSIGSAPGLSYENQRLYSLIIQTTRVEL